jgi:nucleotide-binding universal stress UspA family protein
MFEKILVCLDGSKLAEQILPYATEQAARFNSKVVLLQAFTIPSTVAAAEAQAAPTATPDLMQEEAHRLEAEARAYLEEVAIPLREKGLDVGCVTLQGTAGEVIVGYAQNEPVDLIALATHGHSGLGRVIFGSVADHVLRESGLPILVIKPQEMET